MKREELEKEAEEYIKKNNLEWELECNRISPICAVLQAYKDGAEPREKRIAELEAQIEKMKCCANCEYTPPFDKHCDNCIRGSIKLRYINWQLRR